MKKKKLLLTLPILLGIVSYGLYHAPLAHAAGNTITVDSTADPGTIGDTQCTLREAISNVNSTTGDTTSGDCHIGSNGGGDTIVFSIIHTFSGDTFTNQTKTGYIIAPTSDLPDITRPVTIDGYSETDARANSAPAPDPFNGRLLIQIDGSNDVSGHALLFSTGSNSSVIKGLVVTGFTTGTSLSIHADNIKIQGNYIGTAPDGLSADSNGAGFSATGGTPGINGTLGGLNANERNIISGNNSNGSGSSGGYPAGGWVIQGNYIGIDAHGTAAIPNSTVGGPGGLSIDNGDDVVIGGPEPTAINIISGNYSHGLAPDQDNNLLIEGNYIGTDYTGTQDLGNGGSATAISNCQVLIQNNLIMFNGAGLALNNGNHDSIIVGNSVFRNDSAGIQINNSNTNETIGGTSADDRNTVSFNGSTNIALNGVPNLVTGLRIIGNYIGVGSNGAIDNNYSNANGIQVNGNVNNVTIGGTNAGEGNTIAATSGPGIGVNQITLPPSFGSLVLTPANVSVIGNSIHDISTGQVSNSTPPTGFGSSNLGIDLLATTLNTSLDIASAVNIGANTNVPGGSVPGKANDYLNHPVLNSLTQNGTNASINFNLNVAGATNGYRIEFFSNDTSTPNQGQRYLGFANVNSGDNQTTSLTLPVGTNLTGKYVSATLAELLAAEIASPSDKPPHEADRLETLERMLERIAAGRDATGPRSV